MTKLEIAAETWAKIETLLINEDLCSRVVLDAERPHCIALIASALGAKLQTKGEKVKAASPVVPPSVLPLIDFSKPVRRAAPPVRRAVGVGPSSSLESAMTRRLEQLIEQSVRGYSEDDGVEYRRHA